MLDLNPSLMVIVLIVFFSLLFLLNHVLYNPLLNFMDCRSASIADDLKKAQELSGNSDELYSKAKSVTDLAKTEATAIRQKAIDDAKALANSKFEAKTTELDSKYQNFMKELSASQEELRVTLTSQLPLLKESLKTKLSNL
ncbi:MAG: F0F1 ATP synthase subunit B' [Sulfurovum sp.]|jgi:F-type H+-transporting ATPase subunit b|nr:MAG: F0F1 ATP synthase subunit B' [Sulfurovum sp.]